MDNSSKQWLTTGVIHIAFPDLRCTRHGCQSLFLKILHVEVSFHRWYRVTHGCALLLFINWSIVLKVCRLKDKCNHTLFQSTVMRPATIRSATKLSLLIETCIGTHVGLKNLLTKDFTLTTWTGIVGYKFQCVRDAVHVRNLQQWKLLFVPLQLRSPMTQMNLCRSKCSWVFAEI